MYIEIDGPSPDLPPIARQCGSLRHVAFNGPYADSTREWVSAFLIQLARLQTLVVFYMNEHAFRHVARLEHLESLKVRDLDMEPFPGADLSDPYFPALRRLTLWADSVAFATNFMMVFDHAPLETIVVTSRRDSTALNSQRLFSAIQCFTHHATLTSLTIELREEVDTVFSDTEIYTMSSSVIRVLLGFPNLCHVELSSPVGFILNDEFVDTMACAWSQLESLSIKAERPIIFHSALNPTIMALHSFSHHCPHLHHLSLLVDATNIEMDHPSRTPRTIHTTLRSWHPLYSPLDSPSEVANFISSVFPSLSIFFEPMLSPYRSQWEQVAELVPVYARIRADERRFGATRMSLHGLPDLTNSTPSSGLIRPINPLHGDAKFTVTQQQMLSTA
ncbi:hypothetical protein K438DRAFT_1772709 [Mycena galopus ATCC 62051]|nr:hypothetical protein K438DRAFT_1772709 [Mycena galopus ATCC 62051]